MYYHEVKCHSGVKKYCPKYYNFMLFKRSKAHKRYGPHNIDIISIIFGTLLGDSHAERRSYYTKQDSEKLGATRISFQQENSNMEYLI